MTPTATQPTRPGRHAPVALLPNFQRRAIRLTCLLAVLVVAPPAIAESRWILEAAGAVAAPVEPRQFVDGWRTGLGIGAALRARLGKVEVGVDADFTQFGFTGLERLGTLGGERRMTRVAVPLRVALWRGRSAAFHGLFFQASGGWGHQSIAGSFGGTLASSPKTQDGLAGTLGLRYVRELYRRTRWSAGIRYTRFEFEAESPVHVAFLLGLQMPLEGSRPRRD